MTIVGTNDAEQADETVYDSVVIAADIGAVQKMFVETMNNYKDNQKVSAILDDCYKQNIGQMKIAPDYKVIINCLIIIWINLYVYWYLR